MSKIQIIFFILGSYVVKESWAVTCNYYSTYYNSIKYKYCSDSCCLLDTSSCCSYSYYYSSYVSSTLSGGIIAAIVIGSLIPIIIIAVVCACVCCAAGRRTRTTGVVYGAQPAGVTTVTTANASQMVATPAYPGQPAPVYNVQGGFSGQVNAGYSQPPPNYEAPKY
uniref:Cysteine and tyrosine-rich protein 1 n=1 Tax=Pinctada fucata TaxID=50426 RepID=A0A194ALM5_PINFU